MKFSKIVAEAREAAYGCNSPLIVYQNLNSRWWNRIPKYSRCTKGYFYREIQKKKYPLIRLLLIYPNGTVVQ